MTGPLPGAEEIRALFARALYQTQERFLARDGGHEHTSIKVRSRGALAVAEHAMALARKLPEARDNRAKEFWRGMMGDQGRREDELGGGRRWYHRARADRRAACAAGEGC